MEILFVILPANWFFSKHFLLYLRSPTTCSSSKPFHEIKWNKFFHSSTRTSATLFTWLNSNDREWVGKMQKSSRDEDFNPRLFTSNDHQQESPLDGFQLHNSNSITHEKAGAYAPMSDSKQATIWVMVKWKFKATFEMINCLGWHKEMLCTRCCCSQGAFEQQRRFGWASSWTTAKEDYFIGKS